MQIVIRILTSTRFISNAQNTGCDYLCIPQNDLSSVGKGARQNIRIMLSAAHL